MEIANDLKEVLDDPKIQDMINKNNYSQLYSQLTELVQFDYTIGELTELLLAIDINPLDYMDHIPRFYLAWTKINHFKVPQHIITINSYALLYCKSLKSIIVSNNVTQIGYQAFGECIALTSITFGKNLKKNSSKYIIWYKNQIYKLQQYHGELEKDRYR